MPSIRNWRVARSDNRQTSMSDNGKHIAPNESHDFSNDVIRHFLLGQLIPAEQRRFEERLLGDDEFAARVRLAEIDLTDDYACRRLKTADRTLFEEYFLVSAERHRIFMVSSA